jgi:ribulose-phosphate 3-epimerase
MTERPEDRVDEFATAGADVVFFHLEATPSPIRLRRRIERLGMIPGLAIGPTTPLPEVPELLAFPELLLMTVEPGYSGQEWLPSSVHRIERLRGRMPSDARLTVDGHVNERTIRAMAHAGADAFVAGSTGLFTSPSADYGARASALRAAIAESGRVPGAPEQGSDVIAAPR